MIYQIFIIPEDNFPMCAFQRYPSDLTDFFFLTPGAVIIGISKKIHHLFADIRFGIVFHALTESLFQLNGQSGFLVDFPQSGFHLGFSLFYMSFRK